MRSVVLGGIAAAVLLVSASRTPADEGLWPLNRVPVEKLAAERGFEPDGQWLEHVQKSCVRIGQGGSGCFVSAQGLILTNHHVGMPAIDALGDDLHDYVQDGFLATAIEDELPCPGLRVSALMGIRDITERVEAAVAADMEPGKADAVRRSVIAGMEAKAARATGWHAETVSLFGGARHDMYLYKQYGDVRLVMAPELDVARFGGDEANFEYPRYSLDLCFFRAYENGVPARTEHYLAWSGRGVSPGDLVLVAGHPARTRRQHSVVHLEFLRDFAIPLELSVHDLRELSLLRFASRSARDRRDARGDLLAIQNSRKALEAYHSALLDHGVWRTLQLREKERRDILAALGGSAGRENSPWPDISAGIGRTSPVFVLYYLLEGNGVAFGRLFSTARHLVRLPDELGKPGGVRSRPYRSAELQDLTERISSPARVNLDLERVHLRDGLVALVRTLTADHGVVKTALNGLSPEARADQLINGTHLHEVEFRRQLLSDDGKAIPKCADPLMVFARSLEARAQGARKQYDDVLNELVNPAYGRIAKAVWEHRVGPVYPEATGTLRLSVGTVAGYSVGELAVPAMTRLRGAYELAEGHADLPIYRLPDRWLTNRSKLDLDTPYNFICTADITGGNSGSPVVNADGLLVGLVFDGNRQTLAWDFNYDQQQGRAVAIDARAWIEILRTVYGADGLVDELLAAK